MADRRVAFVVIALCVVALALTASTLSSDEWAQRGSGEGEGIGVENPETPEGVMPVNTTAGSEPPSLISPNTLGLVIGIAILLGIPGFLVMGRARAAGAVLSVIYIVAIIGLVALFTTYIDVDTLLEQMSDFSVLGGGESGAATDAQNTDRGTQTSPVVFGVLGIALLMAVGLVFYASSSVDSDVDVVEPEEEEPDMEDVGQAAGMAADYIAEDAGDLSNGVYEAYHELTTALEVPNPETATPGEFASAAVGAGLDSDRVREITTLFEEVRYGDEPPSDEREQRALDALRAIEAEYTDQGDGDSPPADADRVDTETGGDAA